MKALQSYNHRLYNKLQRKRHLHLECTCDVTSTIGQCSTSTYTEGGEGDVARMSDLSSEIDSPIQIHQVMYTHKRRLNVRKADQNDGIVISGSGTSSSNGSEHELDGPNHGIHPHQVMKAPFPPVSKDNPFTKQRRCSDGASQKRSKEQTQPTKTRFNNEFLCHTITSDVLDMEGSLTAQFKEVKKLKYKLTKLKKQAVHNAGVRKQYRHYINYSSSS
ncbi:uncharacterized protein [Haliotis cracherodii]|uniref:uncharacterized protein n=1 Tax=Haliotis cracherodii TaxID=6455 RepID=UPI0039EC2358